MSAGPALISWTAATSMIVGGIIAVGAALLPPPVLGDPGSVPAHFERAMLHWQRGEIEQARQEFGRMLRLKRRAAELAVEEL